jgi:tetratricopeptide (TPR) repeat protein
MQEGTTASRHEEDVPPHGAAPLPEEVEAQLQKILNSPLFRGAPRHSRFLTFVVRKALAGEADNIKEYPIGLEVFDRKADFDPGSDPVVRSEARRLRSRLSEYYESLGRLDPIYISLPKGTYVPTFHRLNGKAIGATSSVVAPDGRSAEHPSGTTVIPRPGGKRQLLIWGLAFVVAAGVVAGLVIHLLRTSSPSAVKGRRSVAVIGFANLSRNSEGAWLSTALPEMMTTQLAIGGKLLAIPDESVARAKSDLKLSDRNGFSEDTLKKIRRNLNADLVVSGAYTVLPPVEGPGQSNPGLDHQVRLDLRVQNAATGETLETISETGTELRAFELATRAGQQVRQQLGIEPLASPEIEEARLSVSSNPEALRRYSQALGAMRRFDALSARDLLQQAVNADPQYAMAYSALAEAWLMLGYDAKAEQAAKRAYELSGKLGLEQKLLIEGRYHETAHQWKEAITAYGELYNHYPDNIEYGLSLTRAQRQAAQYQDALKTVESLKKLPQPVADDPRITLAEAAAYSGLGDANHFTAAVRLAEGNASRNGALAAQAQAQLLYGDLVFLGSVSERKSKLESAQKICESLGNLDCVARVHLRMGMLGFSTGAAPPYEQAIAGFQAVGDMRGVADAQRALGNAYTYSGELDKATRYHADSLATCEKIQDRTCIWKETLNQGNIAYIVGSLAQAEEKFRAALAIARETGDSAGIALCLGNLGSALWLQGKLNEALSSFDEGLNLSRPRGNQYAAWALADIAGVLLDQGKLTEARRSAEEAIATYGQETPPGDSMMTLGTIEILEGKAGEAETRLRRTAEYFEGKGSKEDAAAYYDRVALALLAQNKPDEAQKAVAHARSLLPGETTGLVPLHLTITEALVETAVRPADSAAVSKAILSLHDVRAKSQKGGFAGVELQARLAEGEIELKSGDATKARAQLAVLERDARSKEYGLIARQASEISRGSQ